jgi:thiamine kinase-like enzyme
MEHIAGRHLDNYILDFLLCGKSDAVIIFYRLGKAVRELHYLDLDGLHESAFPSSCSELKKEVVKLSRELFALKIIDHKLINAILKSMEKVDLTNEIFHNVSLHGEFYFTHILVQDGKFSLLDFHNACRGPAYFDLAMLSASLYVSLIFPFHTLKQLTFLIEAFLRGYYEKRLNAEIIRSMKLAELYIILRGILMRTRYLRVENSLIIRLLTTLRIRRLKATIKEVILPKLIA